MPYKSIKDLPDSVRGALPDPAQQIWLNVFNSAYDSDACKARGDDRETCAIKQAWAVVGRQYKKGDDGKWQKIGNLSTFETVSNLVHSPHDVTLQRLDTLIKAGEEPVLYKKAPFENVAAWSGIPVIFAHTAPGEPAVHPDHTAVLTGTLSDRYTVVGTTTGAYISDVGEPLLKTQISFTDDKVDNLAKEGKLSLSTGFEALTGRDETGLKYIAGGVRPNHVLVFLRGGCPNCYPNDNSAMFNNLIEGEDPMEEEKIKNGLVGALKEYFGNTKPAPTQAAKEEIMDVKETEEFKNLTTERDALKTELDALKAEKAQTEKDLRWDTLKNTIPAGWLGEKEAETRKEFEDNPAAFTVKLVEFTNTVKPPEGAEGDKFENLAGDGDTAEAGTVKLADYDLAKGEWK